MFPLSHCSVFFFLSQKYSDFSDTFKATNMQTLCFYNMITMTRGRILILNAKTALYNPFTKKIEDNKKPHQTLIFNKEVRWPPTHTPPHTHTKSMLSLSTKSSNQESLIIWSTYKAGESAPAILRLKRLAEKKKKKSKYLRFSGKGMYESICEMFMQHNVFYILHKDCKTSGRFCNS